MSWFHNSKKKTKKSEDSNSTQAPRRSMGRLHTRRRKKNLLQKMKLMESVPATVIDALHGDASVINSDKDFVRAKKLHFSDGDYYPVFLFDEATMEDAGLGQHRNRDTLGQISVGLKTSSGSTGFVPIATSDSLAQGYVGLLPMHDAFEVLKEFKVINDYKNGWLVGLLRVDGDELSLSKSTLRLTMPEWWSFVNGDLDLIVDHDQLRKSTDVPSTSDPLATDSAEEEGGEAVNHVDQSAALPTGQFDDDDGPASNSNINSFVNSQHDSQATTSESTDSGNDQEGYDIPGLSTSETQSNANQGDQGQNQNAEQGQDQGNPNTVPVGSNESEEPQASDELIDDTGDNGVGIPMSFSQMSDEGSESGSQSTAADQTQSTEPTVDNNQPAQQTESSQNVQQTQNQNPQTPSQEPVNVQQGTAQVGNLNQPQFQVSTSRDDLQARNAILSSSVKTLNDLQVSISDADFVNTYLKPLSVHLIPLKDESNDPTGRIHHENELIEHANEELKGSLNDQKELLRAWFEEQRAGILSALQQRDTKKDSRLAQARKSLEDLQSDLADDQTLRSQARIDIDDQLRKLDQRFEHAHNDARNAAMAEVERDYNDRRERLEQQKQDMITDALAEKKQALTLQVADAKNKLREVARSAATQAYQHMLGQAQDHFKVAQHRLTKRRQLILDKLDEDSNAARQAENERAAHDAEVARHDMTIHDLKQQIARQEQQHKAALDAAEKRAQEQVNVVQTEASTSQQQAVARVQDDLNRAKSERDQYKKQLDSQQDDFNSRLDAHDQQAQDQIAEVKKQQQAAEDKYEKSNRHMWRAVVGSVIAAAIIFGGAGYLGGALNSSRHEYQVQQQTTQQQSNNNDNQRSTQPIIINGNPGNSSSNSSSNSNKDSHSNSNSQSHSSSSSSSSSASSSSQK